MMYDVVCVDVLEEVLRLNWEKLKERGVNGTEYNRGNER